MLLYHHLIQMLSMFLCGKTILAYTEKRAGFIRVLMEEKLGRGCEAVFLTGQKQDGSDWLFPGPTRIKFMP